MPLDLNHAYSLCYWGQLENVLHVHCVFSSLNANPCATGLGSFIILCIYCATTIALLMSAVTIGSFYGYNTSVEAG